MTEAKTDQQVRNEEARQVILYWLDKAKEKIEEETLVALLMKLRERYKIASETPEMRLPEVKKLKLSLSEDVPPGLVDAVCQDEVMIDILKDLLTKRISVTEIIKFISSDESTFGTDIPPLLSNTAEITDDSKFDTAIGDTPQSSNKKASKVQFARAASTPRNPNFEAFESTYLGNSTLQPLRNLTIKDALELIPKFNGTNVNLCVFLDGCREAKALIPPVNEIDLAKLIKMRLYGEALKSAQNKIFYSVDDIAFFFDKIFGSAKTFHQLQGELATLKQKREESVVTFSNRVKAVAQEIQEAARREGRQEGNSREDLEKDKIKFFIRGLHWVIKARMGEAESLEEATALAVEIEREFACFQPEEVTDTLKILAGKANASKAQVNMVEAKPAENCQICQKQGHIARDCWHREGNKNAPFSRARNRYKPELTIGVGPPHRAQGRERFHSSLNRQSQPENRPERNVTTIKGTTNSPNNSDTSCRYCKTEGHWIKECPILLEKNRRLEGNTNAAPLTGAAWSRNESSRPVSRSD